MAEVVKVVEVGPIGGELLLRIEVLRDLDSGQFRARLQQRKTYRLQPRFHPEVADESLWVEDLFISPEQPGSDTAEQALNVVLEKLRKQLPDA